MCAIVMQDLWFDIVLNSECFTGKKLASQMTTVSPQKSPNRWINTAPQRNQRKNGYSRFHKSFVHIGICISKQLFILRSSSKLIPQDPRMLNDFELYRCVQPKHEEMPTAMSSWSVSAKEQDKPWLTQHVQEYILLQNNKNEKKYIYFPRKNLKLITSHL